MSEAVRRLMATDGFRRRGQWFHLGAEGRGPEDEEKSLEGGLGGNCEAQIV